MYKNGKDILMLTPDKIKEKSFQTTGRGSYRAEDVDNFLSEVSASYEQMFKENGELVKKISILVKKIEEYREDEESLKTALLSAQKLADKIVADAREAAEKETADVKAEWKNVSPSAAPFHPPRMKVALQLSIDPKTLMLFALY